VRAEILVDVRAPNRRGFVRRRTVPERATRWPVHLGTVHLVDEALEVLDESGVGVGPLLPDLRAARPIAEAAIAIEWAMFRPPRQVGVLPST
jgi:hypothetical protein